MSNKKENRQKTFLKAVFSFTFLLLFATPALAAKVQCEYIPKDSSQKILYFKGSDADHRPWLKEMEENECIAKCSLLKMVCSVSGFGGPIAQDPEDCDATYLKCGPTASPLLTRSCKFVPRKSDGQELGSGWETLTTSENDCKELCKEACLSINLTLHGMVCYDERSTCEATPYPSVPQETTLPYTYSVTEPTLSISLPTLGGFTELVSTGDPGDRYLLIPWLGEYIAAVYKYAIGVTGVLAGIMLVVAGLIWLTAGGSAERVSTAKSYIEGALVGLVIALTSYVLLYAINPQLTEFEAMKVRFVERIPVSTIIDNIMDTTTTNTIEPGTSGPVPDTFTDCPISLPAAPPEDTLENKQWDRNPRTKAFLNNILSVVTGTTPREKVIQIAQAAVKCGVTLGSCSKTSKNINGLAGIEDRGSPNRELSSESFKFQCTLNCGDRVGLDNPCESVKKSGRPDSPCLTVAREKPCTEKKKEMFDRLKSEISGSSKCATTWPDCWADELQPGDTFVVFNCNSDPPGNHTAIFMGWASEGKAKVIQGAWGGLVKEGTICIKSNCPNPSPLEKTYKAE